MSEQDKIPLIVLTGFLTADGKARGRPVGLESDRTGALLVADDVGNTIWRVARELHLEDKLRALGKDVAVGLVDVKSAYVETPAEIEERIRRCLELVPAERLAVAPDCGLSQTARWIARAKLEGEFHRGRDVEIEAEQGGGLGIGALDPAMRSCCRRSAWSWAFSNRSAT